jgi:microcystin-dependent protein
MFAGNFAPLNWAFCAGQIMSIAQNTALFSLIGTTYGGNGQTTFALPDLRGRFPMHRGNGHVLGEVEGQETHTLIVPEIPAHSHLANYGSGGNSPSPVGNYWSSDPSGDTPIYNSAGGSAMGGAAIASTGGSQPHENRQPFVAINFIIALEGIFPPQN